MTERPKWYDFARSGPTLWPDLVPIVGIFTYGMRISKYREGCDDTSEPIDRKSSLNVTAVAARNIALGLYHVSSLAAIPLVIRIL